MCAADHVNVVAFESDLASLGAARRTTKYVGRGLMAETSRVVGCNRASGRVRI
jgi:hypothetical protein